MKVIASKNREYGLLKVYSWFVIGANSENLNYFNIVNICNLVYINCSNKINETIIECFCYLIHSYSIFKSFFFDLLFQFVSIHYLLEISQSFGSIIKHLRLLNPFSNYLIEDNLKPHWDSAFIQIIVILFPYFLYFWIFLPFSFTNFIFVHSLFDIFDKLL